MNDKIRAIHSLKRKLFKEDDDYRAFLKANFDVTSSKELSDSGMSLCIKRMQAALNQSYSNPVPSKVKNAGESKWGWGKSKFEALQGRGDKFARPAQLRLIDSFWSGYCKIQIPEQRDQALETWLRHQFHIGSIEMVKTEDVSKIIKALEAMNNQKEEAKNGRNWLSPIASAR